MNFPVESFPEEQVLPGSITQTRCQFETVEDAVAVLRETAEDLLHKNRRSMTGDRPAWTAHPADADRLLGLREYAYILEGIGDSIQPDDLLTVCRLLLNGRREDGAFPVAFGTDGIPLYESPAPGRPGTDVVPFVVDVAWHTFQYAGDDGLLEELVGTLAPAMEQVPRNPKTDLVYLDPDDDDSGPNYGYTDTIRKRGDLLFCSLLYVQASRQLADLMQAAGRDGDADLWRATAQTVAKRIRMYFWDKKIGLFRAASSRCRQHDIWGSAFAVYLNVATSGQLMSIARYFIDHYDDIIYRGQLRHLPARTFWEDSTTPAGSYQNGGYWAAPVGWLTYTLNIVDPALADHTTIELAADLYTNGVYQCISPEGVGHLPDYVVSAALPLQAMNRVLQRRENRNFQFD